MEVAPFGKALGQFLAGAEVAAVGDHQMAVRAGPVMAATDEVQITVRGRGGHGAMPHLVVDPVVACAQAAVVPSNIVRSAACP